VATRTCALLAPARRCPPQPPTRRRRRTEDGQRWPAIYRLNRGRTQPGGQELSDPDLI